jgi:hypothetical protein
MREATTSRKSKQLKRFRLSQRGGGFDRNLWNNRPVYNSISYIENNPVRKRLMAQAAEWEWSSGYEGNKDFGREQKTRKKTCRHI